MVEKKNIYDYSREKLELQLLAIGEKKFRATQIFEAIYKNNLYDFETITTLSRIVEKN